MASWFRAAEELFEVVDRRAKQVTDDLLVGGQSPAELGVLGRVLVTNPTTKGQGGSTKPFSGLNESALQNSENRNENGSGDINGVRKDNRILALKEQMHALIEKENPSSDVLEDNNALKESHTAPPGIHETETEVEQQNDSENLRKELHESDNKPAEEIHDKEFKPVECKFLDNDGKVSVQLIATIPQEENIRLVNASLSERSVSSDKMVKMTSKNDNVAVKSPVHNSHNDPKQGELPKLEEQLDEAQGLLKSASSSGQSKEARLARVCAGLSSRLQEYKAENSQLEVLLQSERDESSSLRLMIKELQSELASARAEVGLVESQMSAALASKNMEIETLSSSIENLKKQAALSEGKLAALQADMEVMARSRDMTENGMIQTLKEALEAAENRAEEEHLSHIATRKAAAKRESELEQYVADVTTSLSKMQRTVDERTQKALDLEQKISTLEVDCANLNQELQEMEAKLRREQKRASDDSSQALQIQAWREDADRARQAQREAEGKLLGLEAENQKLRVEVAGLKRDADQFSSQAQAELEKRFRDLTEVLYLKQTQLEEMASEKAATVFQLEKELSRTKEALAEAERHRRLHHSVSVWDDDNDMKPLDSLGLQQRRLVGTSFQLNLQRAAKILDSGAVQAGRFLWRRPLARLGVFFYLVFVHVFLLYLLHRLQAQVVDSITAKEEMEAAAAGLVKLAMRR